VAILATTFLAIGLTLGLMWLTEQWTAANLLLLAPPLGLNFLTALLIAGYARHRLRLDNLLAKNRGLLRDRTLEMLEAQKKVEELQQRAVKLQQQVLQTQAKIEQTRHLAGQQDTKFYSLIQGTIRELNTSSKQLEAVIERIAETPPVNGQATLLAETWQKVDHLTTLALNLEELAYLENNKISLDYRPINVVHLLNEVSSSARGLVAGKPIEIRTQVLQNLPLLHADPDRIRQVLMHLINNAIQYTDEGTIEIQGELTGSEITIFVSDTGLGLSHEELNVIFTEFGRAGRWWDRSGRAQAWA
jgi:signal transduction histidine kinase